MGGGKTRKPKFVFLKIWILEIWIWQHLGFFRLLQTVQDPRLAEPPEIRIFGKFYPFSKTRKICMSISPTDPSLLAVSMGPVGINQTLSSTSAVPFSKTSKIKMIDFLEIFQNFEKFSENYEKCC